MRPSSSSDGKVEYRTVDELVERLIVGDESVAFIPTRDDQQVALELRHRAWSAI